MTLLMKTGKLLGMALLLSLIFVVIPKVSLAASSRTAEVKIFDSSSLTLQENFSAFADKFKGGASVALCDLDADNIDEIVVGSGPGASPEIKIFNADGTPKYAEGFLAFSKGFTGGVNVACGDLDADGQAEIVAGPKSNSNLQVKIFNKFGQPIMGSGFYAYDKLLTGGLNIAIGDIDGSGLNEIIVAPTVGLNSLVKVFNRNGSALPITFHPFKAEYTGGVSLTAADVDGDGNDEIVFGVLSQDESLVKVIKADPSQTVIGSFYAFPKNFKGGVNVSTSDVNDDNLEEIIVAANSGGVPEVKGFTYRGTSVGIKFLAYEKSFSGGVQVSAGDLNNDNQDEFVTTPTVKIAPGKVDRIEVDLSEQRLYAYSSGQMINTSLVSTGIPGMDTHTGTFRISQKIYSKLYSGPNYYLPNTLWNMRFDGPRLLHSAYWHNDFGRRKSHGCVNLPIPEAKWLYERTPIGTTVIVRN